MDEVKLFKEILVKNKMRITRTRMDILMVFLKVEEHITVEAFYRRIKKAHPEIGYATVHRTLKLLARYGLAREINLGDRVSRFEHVCNHKHHDHLVCINCGETVEFLCPEIETQQAKIVEKYRFQPEGHHLQIYGYCDKCRK